MLCQDKLRPGCDRGLKTFASTFCAGLGMAYLNVDGEDVQKQLML
jgi:hypothetical protein